MEYAAGESVGADGVPLRFVAARGSEDGRTGVDVWPTTRSSRIAAIASWSSRAAGRATNANKRLAYLTSSGPSFITPTSAAVVSPSCSPDGGYIAAVASGDGEDISRVPAGVAALRRFLRTLPGSRGLAVTSTRYGGRGGPGCLSSASGLPAGWRTSGSSPREPRPGQLRWPWPCLLRSTAPSTGPRSSPGAQPPKNAF